MTCHAKKIFIPRAKSTIQPLPVSYIRFYFIRIGYMAAMGNIPRAGCARVVVICPHGMGGFAGDRIDPVYVCIPQSQPGQEK